jgi:acetate kinase
METMASETPSSGTCSGSSGGIGSGSANLAARITVLTLNSGSSSLKFCCYSFHTQNKHLELIYAGSISGIGSQKVSFGVTVHIPHLLEEHPQVEEANNMKAACKHVFNWIDHFHGSRQCQHEPPSMVGHRVVFGGSRLMKPTNICPEVYSTLMSMRRYAPEHLPSSLTVIEDAQQFLSEATHIACFDTAFHRSMPDLASTYSIPKKFRDGIGSPRQSVQLRKYGFHGLSYEYIMGALSAEAAANGSSLVGQKIIIAHLGHGASLVAVKDGSVVDTTMGFSPTGGTRRNKAN